MFLPPLKAKPKASVFSLSISRWTARRPARPGLKDSRIAQCVTQILFIGAREWALYELYAWVVMPNHVHVLLQPLKPLRAVTRALKSASARAANVILGRTGMPFWQAESYDHWVRDQTEFNRIVRYIERNPVKAGLVERMDDLAAVQCFEAV